MLDATDQEACMRYRTAYGHASRLWEMSRFDHAWGKDFAEHVGIEHDRILAEVLRRMGQDRRDLVELAVHDAVAKRRQPRW
jgi:hypothetical protein